MLVVLCLTNVLQVFIYAIFQSGNLSKKMLRNKQLNNDRSFQAKIIFQNHRTKIIRMFGLMRDWNFWDALFESILAGLVAGIIALWIL